LRGEAGRDFEGKRFEGEAGKGFEEESGFEAGKLGREAGSEGEVRCKGSEDCILQALLPGEISSKPTFSEAEGNDETLGAEDQ
jgi:hypothetical protein